MNKFEQMWEDAWQDQVDEYGDDRTHFPGPKTKHYVMLLIDAYKDSSYHFTFTHTGYVELGFRHPNGTKDWVRINVR